MKREIPPKPRSHPKQQLLPLSPVEAATSGTAGPPPVVATLARLLLEAAKAGVRSEVADDRP